MAESTSVVLFDILHKTKCLQLKFLKYFSLIYFNMNFNSFLYFMSIQPFNYAQLFKFWFSKNPLKMPQFSTKAKFSSVQSLSRVRLFATPWTAARQASLSITNSWSPPKPMSIESVMPSNHLILGCPLLLLPSILPSIRVFSCESAVRIRWPKYWSFSFSVSPSNEYSGLVSLRMDWLALLAVQGTVVAVGW